MEYRILSDKELIARYCEPESDRAAFDELWRRYEPTIQKFARHLSYMCPPSCSCDLFVEDVFSEAQEKVVTRIEQYEGIVPFSSWLWKITERVAIDQRRKRTGRGPQPREFVELTEQELAHQGAVFKDKIEQDPEHRAIRSERRALLDDILERHSAFEEGYLSVAAIIFKDLYDYQIREVAELLGTYERKIFRLFTVDYPRLRAALVARGIRCVGDALAANE